MKNRKFQIFRKAKMKNSRRNEQTAPTASSLLSVVSETNLVLASWHAILTGIKFELMTSLLSDITGPPSL